TEKGAAIEVETYQIAVGNGRHYGGGNVVEETAEIDDGHLDLYSLEMTNLWKLALMLRSFRSGTHGAWREVRTARCVEFDIETRKAMPVNTDGEIVTSTPAHFKVHPKAISVFAPDRAV
ncbi:MAG: lipid kinase, partial [Mesorhizobium sp.]